MITHAILFLGLIFLIVVAFVTYRSQVTATKLLGINVVFALIGVAPTIAMRTGWIPASEYALWALSYFVAFLVAVVAINWSFDRRAAKRGRRR